MKQSSILITALAALSAPVRAEPADSPETIVVTGRRLDLIGVASSASEGVVGPVELSGRPLLRAGDLLEFVPGLVATQHSGSGKANQYFLRGFNLDHGTDFATFVNGMPVNMRTHGHGQGYTDVNFLIPETVGELVYRKGPYSADVGDFSSAGSARFRIADTLPSTTAELAAGDLGYRRAVLAGSSGLGGGDLLFAGEAQTFDGPWTDIEENVRKFSGLLRYSRVAGAGRAHVTFMGYRNKWNSPDQIPQRAVDSGLIDRFGSIDPTVGGRSHRLSVSGGWDGDAFGGTLSASAYAIDSYLSLFSNFTYLLDDPVNGDQFRQVDDRQVYGFAATQTWAGDRMTWKLGTDGRYDDIGRVALLKTRARQPVGTVRDDAVKEASIGVFASNEFRLTDRLRTHLGIRFDAFHFDVDARSLAANSGESDDRRVSLKASAAYRPIDPLEVYLSYGSGFHSNDARGTTIRIDPVSGDPADPVDPLVKSEGAEVGARIYFTESLHATVAAWTLRLRSELLFVGDAGNTEASRPSKRDGIELGVYLFPDRPVSGEVEVSYTRARFRDDDPAGRRIPGSLPLVIGAGVTAKPGAGFEGSLRVRHFGKYPLIEDNSARSDGSTLVNGRVGWRSGRLGLAAEVYNILDSRDHDIDYFYTSRLPGEPAGGVEDTHFHIFQPRSVRFSASYAF